MKSSGVVRYVSRAIIQIHIQTFYTGFCVRLDQHVVCVWPVREYIWNDMYG